MKPRVIRERRRNRYSGTCKTCRIGCDSSELHDVGTDRDLDGRVRRESTGSHLKGITRLHPHLVEDQRRKVRLRFLLVWGRSGRSDLATGSRRRDLRERRRRSTWCRRLHDLLSVGAAFFASRTGPTAGSLVTGDDEQRCNSNDCDAQEPEPDPSSRLHFIPLPRQCRSADRRGQTLSGENRSTSTTGPAGERESPLIPGAPRLSAMQAS